MSLPTNQEYLATAVDVLCESEGDPIHAHRILVSTVGRQAEVARTAKGAYVRAWFEVTDEQVDAYREKHALELEAA